MSRSADYDTRSISADLEDVSTNLMIAFVCFGNYNENNTNMLYGKVVSPGDRNFGEPYLFNGTSGNKTMSIAKFTTTNEKREKITSCF